jgi:hypothetical protein
VRELDLELEGFETQQKSGLSDNTEKISECCGSVGFK